MSMEQFCHNFKKYVNLNQLMREKWLFKVQVMMTVIHLKVKVLVMVIFWMKHLRAEDIKCSKCWTIGKLWNAVEIFRHLWINSWHFDDKTLLPGTWKNLVVYMYMYIHLNQFLLPSKYKESFIYNVVMSTLTCILHYLGLNI